MKTDKLQLIQMLINNELSEDESRKLTEEIKKDREMKLEFALLMKIKQDSRNKMKEDLLSRMRSAGKTINIGPAESALNEIKTAAFSAQNPNSPEDLPIDEQTLLDFLDEDDEKENEDNKE